MALRLQLADNSASPPLLNPWTNVGLHAILCAMKCFLSFWPWPPGRPCRSRPGLICVEAGPGDPIFAALVSFGVGTLALAVYSFALRPAPTVAMAASAPWWSWLGGLLGAFFVTVIIVLAAQLGATASMAWLLAGQFLAALVLDHFGLISFTVRDVSWPRLAGVALVLAGAYLVNKY